MDKNVSTSLKTYIEKEMKSSLRKLNQQINTLQSKKTQAWLGLLVNSKTCTEEIVTAFYSVFQKGKAQGIVPISV